jgi:hypothetical protein
MAKIIRSAQLFLGASALVLLLTGCGIFESVKKEPKQASLSIDQINGPSVEVTTSIDFLVTQGNRINFEEISVDTISAELNRDYDIRDNLRFYVLATNVLEQTVSFRMRVWIDDKSWYNEEKTLAEGETAQFIYRYSSPVLY